MLELIFSSLLLENVIGSAARAIRISPSTYTKGLLSDQTLITLSLTTAKSCYKKESEIGTNK
ncbi:MAG: hypothetical protein ACI9Q9_001320 [Flavobacterium sp.]|jgi:hypothetical protein